MPLHRFTYYWQYRDRSVISNNCFGCHELNYIFETEYFFTGISLSSTKAVNPDIETALF